MASKYQLDTTVLYRRPNIGAVSDAVIEIRKGSMGTLVPTGLDAPVKLVRVLEGGGHVAMLVDQHYVNGVDVTFFGRRCKANPFIARLARHVDCPIHGTRVVRLPDRHRFRVDLTRGDRAGARRRRPDRHRGHHAGDHRGDRRLGARASGAMAVGAPALALRPGRINM